jgi:sugar-specific transcriptional regulator TrmB
MDLFSNLAELGFTEYEGKVYLALLKENPANGYQLSKKTGVPRSMVYEALGRLHARGAILKSGNGRITIYRPLPPEQLLERYDRQRQQLIHDLRESLNSIYQSQIGESLWTISGQEYSFSYAAQMIANAKDEVFLVLDDVALEQLRREILTAFERGIQVGALLTGNGELQCGQVAYHPPAESELQGLGNTFTIVVDNKECMIANLSLDMVATITTNRNLVLISRQFIWMELFAQRIYRRLNPAMLDLLDESDRHIFQSISTRE